MIKSISIADTATFDKEGIKIDKLGKVNFIYGANGVGKTTITNLLHDKSASEFKNSSIVWDGGTELSTLVYNKNFRERNFGKGSINGVFTLGQATKEEKKAVDNMTDQLAEIKKQGLKRKATLEELVKNKEEAEKDFLEAAWVDVYKKYEIDFKQAFTKAMQKESFKNKLLKQVDNSAELNTHEELKAKAATVFGPKPEGLQHVQQIGYQRLVEIEYDEIWQKKVIGKSDVEISKLIQHLNINDWVNQGRSYLQEDSVCPFCQEKTITEKFRQQIDSYFDQSFKENAERIQRLASEYSSAKNNLLTELDALQRKEEGNPNTKLDLERLNVLLKAVAAQLRENEIVIQNKSKEPSRSATLTSLKEQLAAISKLIEEANIKVKSHNDIVDNFEREKSSLVKAIWRFIYEGYGANIELYLKRDQGRQKGIDALNLQVEGLRKDYLELSNEIKIATKNITSVQPSVDEINKLLKSYGFNNFEIVPSKRDKDQYQIQREDGTVAESTLSEGEVTFITFLYFLQLAKGGLTEGAVTEERILVIDDPISSLDSNVLFIVSTLIKHILDDVRNNVGLIRQVLILTHNVYFHKEVAYVGGRAEEEKNTFFWILRKKNKISTIQSYETKNPIHNSYELLWKELKNQQQIDSITIQNTMRRIIENYFKILGGYHYDKLIESFVDSAEEQEICRSMISWINDGSHTMPDDLYIQSHDDISDKYFIVFEKVFKNTNHHQHFKMMWGSSYLEDNGLAP